MMPALIAKLAGMPRIGQWIIAVALLFLLAASTGAAIVQTVRIDGFLWMDGLTDKLAARDKTITAMEEASKAAAQKAETARIARENQYAQIARRADYAEAQNSQLRAEMDSLHAASDRFAAGRSVRVYSSGGACLAPAPGQAGAAGDHNGPGEDAFRDAVVLTRPEYEDFVSNSIRLERVRQWGETLISEGLAVPLVEFGQE